MTIQRFVPRRRIADPDRASRTNKPNQPATATPPDRPDNTDHAAGNSTGGSFFGIPTE